MHTNGRVLNTTGSTRVTIETKEHPVRLVDTVYQAGRPFIEHRTRVRTTQNVLVHLSIDLDEVITALGQKAARSKSGKATMMNGLIRAKVTERTIVKTVAEPVKTSLDISPERYRLADAVEPT